MNEETPDSPIDPALRASVIAAIRTRARWVVVPLAIGLVWFVSFAAEAGKPVWLALVIGVFGAILIGFLIALVWFWLHVVTKTGAKEP